MNKFKNSNNINNFICLYYYKIKLYLFIIN